MAATAVGQSEYPLTYQWQSNGTNISGATTSTYTDTISSTPDGAFTVIVTNAAGSTNMTWDFRLALPGMVEAWGADDSEECDRPVTLTNTMGIAAGEYHSLAVTDSGNVVQWGQYWDGASFYSLGTTPSYTNLVAVAA